MNRQLELSLHPQLLFDQAHSIKELWFCGHRLGDSAQSIDRQRIRNVTIMPLPSGINEYSYKDKKIYYVVDGQSVEYRLSERIAAAYDSRGWLHTDDSINYRIRHGRIVEIRIVTPLLTYYQTINKMDIQAQFGLADQIIEEDGDSGPIMTTFIYHDRMMRIYYRDDQSTIEGINLGESLIDYANR